MATLKIATAQGFSKEEAFASLGLDLELKYDATTAWKKEEEPKANSPYFDAFAHEHLQKKIKGLAGVACSVTVESGVADSRERPYKVDNVVTKGARKYKTVYEGFVGETIVLSKDTKSEAEEAAKKYVTENRVDVEVRVRKEVKEGQAVAMTVKYTPSLNTKKGTYIFFGYEK